MYKEKHILNKTYGTHQLSRYLDVYELDTVNCSADKTTGYKGDTITITGTPAWNEKTSAYSVTGATLTGNQFDFTGSDVTAQANYETAKNVILQTDGNGSIAASRLSGFIGDTVTLSNTASDGYEFSAYTLTGANLTGSTFNLTGSNVTAKAWYLLTATPNPEKFLRDTNGVDIYNRSDMLNKYTLSIGVHNDDRYMYEVNCFDPVSAHYNYLVIDYDMSNTITIPGESEVFNGLSAGACAIVCTTTKQYTQTEMGFYDRAFMRDQLYSNSAMFLNNSPIFGGVMGSLSFTASNTAAFVSADHMMYKAAPTTTKHYRYIHDIRYGGVSAWVNNEYMGKMSFVPVYDMQSIRKRGMNNTTLNHVSVAVFNTFTAASAWQR